MLNIVVFVSGRGSNLKSILNSIENREMNAEILAVVSDNIDCPAFQIAQKHKIPTFTVGNEKKDGIISYSQLINNLKDLKIGLIVLAGFLKKIPEELIDSFQNRIINIHPALLPAFGGKGMYGINVHRAVFEKSCKVSGATVHFVDKIYDNGKIIAQRCVEIEDVKTPEQIAEKVLSVEHQILPFVIRKFSEGKIVISEPRVRILE